LRRRPILRPEIPPGPLDNNPEAWTIIPASHRDWIDGWIKIPSMIICADAACGPRVLQRLFAHPRQRVYGIVATDNYYSAHEVHQMYWAYGREIHRCRS
jgi:hypothetical protein